MLRFDAYSVDGMWRYGCLSADGLFTPSGYCRSMRSAFILPSSGVPYHQAERVNKVIAAYADQFHSGGHATREDAYRCYRTYLLDLFASYSGQTSVRDLPCRVLGCRSVTRRLAKVDFLSYALCEKHNKRSELERLAFRIPVGVDAT